jgi:hypothetical protein
MTKSVRLPTLSLVERVRLFASYQRYAALLLGLASVAVIVAVRTLPWWAAVVVGLVAIVPVRFGVEVALKYARKVRATRVGMARIESGAFTPASIKHHCGDPCFRVVADELLALSGMPRAERKLVISTYREQLHKEDSMLVMVDHVRGTVITFGGETREGN